MAVKPGMKMKPMNVELHIEELVLHGFAPGDRYRIGEAVERELQRLLTVQGAPNLFSGNVEHAQIRYRTFNVQPKENSDMIRSEISREVNQVKIGGMSYEHSYAL